MDDVGSAATCKIGTVDHIVVAVAVMLNLQPTETLSRTLQIFGHNSHDLSRLPAIHLETTGGCPLTMLAAYLMQGSTIV